MSLHHVGDEINALRVLGDLLEPSGLLAIAEVLSDPSDPRRVVNRGDVFVASSRQIAVARALQHP